MILFNTNQFFYTSLYDVLQLLPKTVIFILFIIIINIIIIIIVIINISILFITL